LHVWFRCRFDYAVIGNTRKTLFITARRRFVSIRLLSPVYLFSGVLSASKKAQVQSKKGNKFHLLHISLLREYFELELKKMQNQVQFPIDIESVIDDFVLLCFFVGNDFVPTLPGLGK
jgi:hypothetical protein